MDNENKKSSRNGKRRIERKIKIDNNMKSLLNRNKREKKKKHKKNDEIKELEIELVKIKYANKPDKLDNALKELNKSEVIKKKLHETKYEIFF